MAKKALITGIIGDVDALVERMVQADHDRVARGDRQH